MTGFILKKILYGILVMLGVVSLVFLMFHYTSGDIARNLVGESANEAVVQNIRRKFNLDLPAYAQYAIYLNDLSPVSVYNPTIPESRISLQQAQFRYIEIFKWSQYRAVIIKWPWLQRSLVSQKSVSEMIADAIPGTAILAFSSMLFAMMLGLIMGIVAAIHRGSFYDQLMLIISALGMSGPSFFVAVIVAWLGAIVMRDHVYVGYSYLIIFALFLLAQYYLGKNVWWKKWNFFCLAFTILLALILPTGHLELPGTGLNMTGSLYGVDVWNGKYLNLQNLILPMITLMIRPLSVIVQLTRSSLLDVLKQDFIRTARAKGLSESRIIWRHALPNALNPVITAASGWFASLLAGAVFVEFVFGWKGLGQEMFAAIEKQDIPVVMGGVLVISAIFVAINAVVDISYGMLDPRVRK